MNELLEQENMIKEKELLHKHDILYKFKNEKNEIKIDMNKFKDFCKNLINKNADIFNVNSPRDKNAKESLPTINSEKILLMKNNNITNERNKGKVSIKNGEIGH